MIVHFLRLFCSINDIQAGLKVRGLGGSAPQLLAQLPQLRGEWGGRLREGIRERDEVSPQLFQSTLSIVSRHE